jgi:hypothetical protein
VLKRSPRYLETLRSTFAQVVLHGKGPSLWEDKWDWCPKSYGVEDVLLPSKTLVSLENLDHFAVFCQYTPGTLYRKVNGEQVDPGWNTKLVRQILASMKDKNFEQNDGYNEALSPEKLQERYKANAGYYDSDAVPTIDCWKLYSRDESKMRKVAGISAWFWILASKRPAGKSSDLNKKEFLYESKQSYGEELCNLAHFQFADGANVAPFRYHSVRSIGFLLYAVCHLQNRLRCRLNRCLL